MKLKLWSPFRFRFLFYDLVYPACVLKTSMFFLYNLPKLQKIVLSNYINNLLISDDVLVIKSLLILKFFAKKRPFLNGVTSFFKNNKKFFLYSGKVTIWHGISMFQFVEDFFEKIFFFLKRRYIQFPLPDQVCFSNFNLTIREINFFSFLSSHYFQWMYKINVSMVFSGLNFFNKSLLKFVGFRKKIHEVLKIKK